jgi:hypothetical protein
MSQTSIPTETFALLEPATDTNFTFELVLDHFERGILQVPQHQREPDAWPLDKQRRYVERLKESREGCHPPGTLATYQLKGYNGSAVYLNDGLQRLTTLQHLKDSPFEFGMDDHGVTGLLRQTIPRQHRHYEDHDHAMRDFQLINAGTHLTPWELCQGYLKYMPSFHTTWMPLFKQVHEALSSAELQLQTGRAKTNRETSHKHRRDNLALFHRFLTKETAPSYYVDVATRSVDNLVDNKTLIELRLRDALLARGRDESRKQIKMFSSCMEREVALLNEKRLSILGAGIGLQPVLWRWFLHFAIWRRNNNVAVAIQEELIEKALKATQGKAQWPSLEGQGVTFALAHLGRLQRIAELAQMDDLVQKAQIRRRHDPRLRPGYQASHLEPFVTDGDGQTFPEPGSLNMARGAVSVETNGGGESDS